MRWGVGSKYDRRGARESLTYPTAAGGSGTVLTLTADSLGRLTQIHDGATVVATLTHVGAGRLAKIQSQDDSVWQGLDWDAAGRRTRGNVTQGEGENAPLHFEEEIAFDADDRVLSVKWPHLVSSGRPQVQQYGYDEQARLLKVEQGYGTRDATKCTFTQYSSFHDFRLDEQGNWAEHQDGAGASFVSPTIAQDNAYTTWPVSGGSTLDFVLDDTGRFLYERPLPNDGGKYLYRHDGLGRLVSAEKHSAQGQIVSTSSYGYTADGRLAWRKEGAEDREWLIYDGSQAVVQIQQPSQGVAALTWTHVWAGSRLVRSTKHPAGTVYHPHQDRLGSIVVVTRQGQAAEKKLYDAYGRLVAVPNDHDTTPLSIPFGYAGARWEATAGLYQMGARWYDPELGRFIEQDPIGEAGGLNLYAYVGSSPTLWVDPTGLAQQAAFTPQRSLSGSNAQMQRLFGKTLAAATQARAEALERVGNNIGGLIPTDAEQEAATDAMENVKKDGAAGTKTPDAKKASEKSESGATSPPTGNGSAPPCDKEYTGTITLAYDSEEVSEEDAARAAERMTQLFPLADVRTSADSSPADGGFVVSLIHSEDRTMQAKSDSADKLGYTAYDFSRAEVYVDRVRGFLQQQVATINDGLEIAESGDSRARVGISTDRSAWLGTALGFFAGHEANHGVYERRLHDQRDAGPVDFHKPDKSIFYPSPTPLTPVSSVPVASPCGR